jgi:hypothetical protein
MAGPTGFSPSDFMTEVETMGGLSRRWKYSVSITPPSSMSNSVPSGKIDFLALTIMMPGKTTSTTEQMIYGINKTVPYLTTYDPVLLTMLNPADWSARKFWDEWLDHIHSPSSKNIRYYKSMVGQVEISQYDDETTEMNPSNARYTAVLEEAWPERMGPYALGWENTDLGNFEISLRFKEWHEKGTQRHNKAPDRVRGTGNQAGLIVGRQ